MIPTEVGELATKVPVFGERDALGSALQELSCGRPAVVVVRGIPHLLHPADVVGHSETRRLVDLPLSACDPVPYDTHPWQALRGSTDAEFVLVSRGRDGYALASRLSVLEALVRASGRKGTQAATTVLDVLEQSPEGIVVLDDDRRAFGLNAAGRRMLATLGHTPGESVVAFGNVPLERLLEDAKQGLPRDIVLQEPAHRLISVRTLRGSNDQQSDTVFVMRDVTHVRHRQAREAAQERMAVLGQLASGIAHDMNNLLTVIMGSTSLMAAERLTGTAGAEQIELAATRAAGLIRQLLAFARRELAEPVVLDAGPLLRDLEGILQRLAGESLALELDVPRGEFPLRTDPVQLERIVVNLLVNARNAMPDGGRITIGLSRHPACPLLPKETSGEARDAICITVADTGRGIDASTLGRVFEPYFTTNPGNGTGLGLATVHATVTQLGGHITVKSEVGAGTRFDVYLPASNAHDAGPVPSRAAPGTRRQRRSGSLLVAERDQHVAAVVREVLEAGGYAVTVARTADEVLRLSERGGEPDLLIADVALGAQSGVSLALQMRKLYPKLRVLITSGYAQNDVLRASEHPLIEYIAKPFSGSQLLERVEAIVGPADDA